MGCCHPERFSRSESPCKLSEPSQCQSDYENENGASYNFPESCFGGFKVKFSERHESGDPHDKHKEGEDQIGRCEPVPVSMSERCIYVAPRAGIVDHDHAGNGDAAEYVEGQEAVALLTESVVFIDDYE